MPPEPALAPLEYRSTRHLEGLDEHVTVVKTPFSLSVRRADGRVQDYNQAAEEEAQAHRQKYGAMLPSFRAFLSGRADSELLPVVIYFDTPPPSRPLAEALFSEDETTKLGAQATLRQQATEAAKAQVAWLAAMGLQEPYVVEGMPAVFGQASLALTEVIAKQDRVRLVMGQDLGEMKKEAVVDPIAKLGINTVFNANGFFGNGRKVGVVESAGGYGIFDRHQAFHNGGATSNVVHSNPGGIPSCTYDFECGATSFAACDAGKCRDMHASQVASVISAFGSNGSTSQGYSASKSTIFFPNANSGQNVNCNATNIASAYSWLQANGVTISNESFNCFGSTNPCDTASTAGVDGLTQDFYSRSYDMLVLKAAGNADSFCDLRFLEACRNTNNSVCVGASNQADQMSCFSVTNNPGTVTAMGSGFTGDREEPDLVALGGDRGQNPACSGKAELVKVVKGTRDVAGVLSDTAWDGNAGTSFSTPAVAAVAALTQEACLRNQGRLLGGLTLRALLRNAAWAANPSDTLYSKGLLPGSTGYHDFKDGAGVLSAAAAMEFCAARGTPGVTSGVVNVDLTQNNPMPSGRVVYQDLRAPEQAAPGLQLSNHAPPSGPGSTPRSHTVIYQIPGLASGRIRFTFSWHGCALSGTGNGPSKARVDFDAFLYNQTTQQYVAGSQSVDDVNEGFDYAIPVSGEVPPTHSYALIVSWPVGATGCEGNGVEGGAWALKWGF